MYKDPKRVKSMSTGLGFRNVIPFKMLNSDELEMLYPYLLYEKFCVSMYAYIQKRLFCLSMCLSRTHICVLVRTYFDLHSFSILLYNLTQTFTLVLTLTTLFLTKPRFTPHR